MYRCWQYKEAKVRSLSLSQCAEILIAEAAIVASALCCIEEVFGMLVHTCSFSSSYDCCLISLPAHFSVNLNK